MKTLNFPTLSDARTYVGNSGVVDWDWGTGDDDTVIDSTLPEFLYQHGHEFTTLNDALQVFIPDVLHQDIGAYDFN